MNQSSCNCPKMIQRIKRTSNSLTYSGRCRPYWIGPSGQTRILIRSRVLKGHWIIAIKKYLIFKGRYWEVIRISCYWIEVRIANRAIFYSLTLIWRRARWKTTWARLEGRAKIIVFQSTKSAWGSQVNLKTWADSKCARLRLELDWAGSMSRSHII